MMELGACVKLVGRVPPLDYDRVQQSYTKVAHLAKVTAVVTVRPFPWLQCIILCQSSRVFLNTPFVFSSCTKVSGELELQGNPLHFPNS